MAHQQVHQLAHQQAHQQAHQLAHHLVRIDYGHVLNFSTSDSHVYHGPRAPHGHQGLRVLSTRSDDAGSLSPWTMSMVFVVGYVMCCAIAVFLIRCLGDRGVTPASRCMLLLTACVSSLSRRLLGIFSPTMHVSDHDAEKFPTISAICKENACVICFDAPADAGFMHADLVHFGVCYACAQESLRCHGRCAVCNQSAQLAVRVYDCRQAFDPV
jgi:hypothetical protein